MSASRETNQLQNSLYCCTMKKNNNIKEIERGLILHSRNWTVYKEINDIKTISLKKDASLPSCETRNKIMAISRMWEFCFPCKSTSRRWKERSDEMRVRCINKPPSAPYKRRNSLLYLVSLAYRFAGRWEWLNVVTFLSVGPALFLIASEPN